METRIIRKSQNWVMYQPNDKDLKNKEGDCVIRAICKATGKTWLQVFDELCVYARKYKTMPNCPSAYKNYLEDMGYKWTGLKVEAGQTRPTPNTFNKKHATGTYIFSLANHLVTMVDGKFYDTWDSGNKCIYGYWIKE